MSDNRNPPQPRSPTFQPTETFVTAPPPSTPFTEDDKKGFLVDLAHRSEAEINQEKALKPRPDLLPSDALMGGGRVMAYGLHKHGKCTWRIAGTKQAEVETHIASAYRHLLEFISDSEAVEAGSGEPVLFHALAQITIAIDLILNPPQQKEK